MRARSLPRPGAERAAFGIVLVEFLNATHPDTDPLRCAWCGKPEALLPIGVGERHAWLHDCCWAPWREDRRKAAIETLWRSWGSWSLRRDPCLPLLEAIEALRPPDVSNDRWQTAVDDDDSNRP